MLSITNTAGPPSLFFDEDIHSVRNFNRRIDSWVSHRDKEIIEERDECLEYWEGIPNEVRENDNIEILHKFETAQGVVRDARRIESQLLGLVITQENFSNLRDSFDDDVQLSQFAKQILQTLGLRAFLLPNRNAIDKMESMWTGRLLDGYEEERHCVETEDDIYVQLRVSYFIDHEWNQVRQLNYLAVTEAVIPQLLECVCALGVSRRSIFDSSSCPKMTEESLTDANQRLLNRNVRQDFVAALCRRTYFFDSTEKITESIDANNITRVSLTWRMIRRPDDKPGSPGLSMEHLVHTIHEKFRVGRLHISQPFLVNSSRIDFDSRILWDNYTNGEKLPGYLSHYGKVIVRSTPPKVRLHLLPLDQSLCLYSMDGSVTEQNTNELVESLGNSIAHDHVYYTLRRDRTSVLSAASDDNRKCYAFRMKDLKPQCNVSEFELCDNIRDWYDIMKKRMQRFRA
jgi:hypothetical protein